jgi:4-hydroxybutyrate CoA-transferase
MTAQEAVKHIKSSDNVFIHSAAAVPKSLVSAMTDRHEELRDVSIYQIHTEGAAPYSNLDLTESFTIKAFLLAQTFVK